jgi:two-component system sensor histidine kinase MtrB
VAFVLVAGALTAALAATTFLVVREARLRDSLDRAERETRFGLRLATDLGGDTDLQPFVARFEQREVHAFAIVDGSRYASNPSVEVPIPAGVRELVADGQLAFERLDVDGVPYLLVGGRPVGSAVELYLAFSEEGVRRDLSQLGRLLLIGWVATAGVSALVGWLVARRTLAPVGRAGRAARALAEGLLDTRLPVASADEFGSWAASFNQMAEALQAKITALTEATARERRFTSDVAHELRTPLTALVAEASILAEHLDRMPPEAARTAELLIADVARLRRLVEDLMTIARFDAGREDVRADRVELSALVAATIRARGWTGLVHQETEETWVHGDRRRIETIVANLVANAVDHGGRDVTVRVGAEAGGAVVEVADRGAGIDPRDVLHVFERFYKADPARTGGSGLGLSIALENARLLGGDLAVWSEPGRGTRFTLRLPVAEPLRGGDATVASGGQDGGDPIEEASAHEADPGPVDDPGAAGRGLRGAGGG